MGQRFRSKRNRQYKATEGRQKGDAQKITCPRCKHDKMWGSRGMGISKYKNKCCKCGHEVIA